MYLLVYKYLSIVVQTIENKEAHIGVFKFGFLKLYSIIQVLFWNYY